MPDKAHSYLQEAIKLSLKCADKPQLSLCWQELAFTYLKQNRPDQAYLASQKAVLFIKQSGFTMEIMKALETSADLQQATGHYQEALLTYREHSQLKDSLFSLEKAKAISKIQSTYELEKKENTILLLNKNAQLHRFEANAQAHKLKLAEEHRRLLVGWLGALLLLVAVIGYSLRQAHLAQRQLALQKQEIERQALELQEANQLKDRLFAVVGHDLRSPIISLQYLIQQVQQTSQHDTAWPSLLTQLTDRVGQLGRLVNNLLYWSLAQQGLLSDRSEWLSLSELFTDCQSLFTDIIHHKALQMEVSLVAEPVWADESQLQIILRNLLDNAIKFSPTGGTIHIQGTNQVGGFGLTISNQVGSQAERQAGANLGLKTIAELVERHAGSLSVEQTDPERWRASFFWPAPSPAHAETQLVA